jgi:AcrR family transcriptional regulator
MVRNEYMVISDLLVVFGFIVVSGCMVEFGLKIARLLDGQGNATHRPWFSRRGFSGVRRPMLEKSAKGKGKTKPRQRRRVKATRMKLLNAARDMFAEKGFDSTTIDDITERADVGKGTFYYHFTDKQDLIGELIKRMMGELMESIDKRCEDTDDLPTLLDDMVKIHIDFFRNRWEDFVLYFQGLAGLKLQESYSGLEAPFLSYLESIENLVDSVINHRLPPPLLRRFGCAVAGFVSGYYSFAVISTEGEDVDKALMEMRGAFVSSLTRFINEAMSTDRAKQSLA